MGNNTVERAIRPTALNRKDALCAGPDVGGIAWCVIALLIKTCKINGVEPHAYLAEVFTKIVQGWPACRLDELNAVGLRGLKSPLTNDCLPDLDVGGRGNRVALLRSVVK